MKKLTVRKGNRLYQVTQKIISLLCIFTILATPLMSVSASNNNSDNLYNSRQQNHGWEEIQQIPDLPLESTPVRLRKAAYELLLPIAADSAQHGSNKTSLSIDLVNRLIEDNETNFFDEGRITNVIVLEHDWDLSQELVKIINSKSVNEDTKQICLNGLYLLLRADRHIAELAVADGKVMLSGAEAAQNLDINEINQAQARLNAAEISFQNGQDALRKGDADQAAHHFLKAWEFVNNVISIWGLSYGGDRDQDGVVDVVELRLGSSPFSEDTDNDGLSDKYELNSLIPYALPNNPDTDGNGISDGEEDLDGDGLIVFVERDLGTDPLIKDTDKDSLPDGDEVNIYNSDPLLADTDNDGLRDDSEIRLGADIRNPDSDNNGIPDEEDSFSQTLSNADMGVTVDLVGVGDHSQTFHVISLAGIEILNSVPGLVGHFVNISTELPFESANVQLSYDPALVPDGDFENLRLFHYDIEQAELQLLPNQQVDIANHLVSADTTQFSPFAILYLPKHDEPTLEKAVRAGFDANVYGPNDDGSYPCSSSSGCSPQKLNLGFTINFFGKNYNSFYLNNNGNVTFDSALFTYTPFDLTATQRVIIAPFFADVDTRVGNRVRFGSGIVDGHAAFGVTWPGVGCYSNNNRVLDYFQLILIDRSDIAPKNFDIEFNYNSIQWETGQASGGNSVCLKGASARVGYSNGTGNSGTFYELPGSGIPGSFLDSNTASGLIHLNLNSSQLGRYIFPVRAGAPVPGQDSDQDGLTDAQETSGFRTQFGGLVFTDPFEMDTDADGLSDGDEITGGPKTFKILSDPTLADTDDDGVEDFVELYGLEEYTLNPFNPDMDSDGLTDGDEVNVYATDPLTKDTDGDAINDGEEVNQDLDPLFAAERIDALKVTSEFAIGAVCGEFCIDDPAHGNMAFFSGLLITGAVSAIPHPITWVIGFIADARDLVASLISGDWASIGLNTLALIPNIGDAADVLGTVGKFVAKHADMIPEVAIFISRMDGLPEAARIGGLVAAYGDEVIDALGNKGLDVAKLQRLNKAAVNLKRLNEVLEPLIQNYPGLPQFLRMIPAEAITDSTGILKITSDQIGGLTVDLKGLAAATKPKSIASYLGNIKGAYTEWLVSSERTAQGWQAVQKASHINAAGYDLVVKKGNVYRLVEAKARTSLSLSNFKNYFTKNKSTGELLFKKKYFLRNLKQADPGQLLETGKFEIEFYLNGPDSARLAQELLDQMGGTVAKYDLKGIPHEIRIIITAVSQ